MQLTDEQQRILDDDSKNKCIIAGAGSGKTTTLVAIIKKLLDEGVNPKEIMLITFTKKAAEEFNSRLKINCSTFGTFHSVWLKLLTKYVGQVNILSDNKQVVRKILEQSIRNVESKTIDEVINGISAIKNNGYRISEYLLGDRRDNIELPIGLENPMLAYEEYMISNNLYDFDDLIVESIKAMQGLPEMRLGVRTQIKYVIVDEYQDSNIAQEKLLHAVVDDSEIKLTVVGDPAQSIYGFRNSDINNILNFGDKFDSSNIFNMSSNFRSNDELLKYSNSVLEKLHLQGTKQLVNEIDATHNRDAIKTHMNEDEDECAAGIISAIQSDMEENPNLKLSDFCVLSRTNVLAKNMYDKMRKKIPCAKPSKTDIFGDKYNNALLLAIAYKKWDEAKTHKNLYDITIPTKLWTDSIWNKIKHIDLRRPLNLIEASVNSSDLFSSQKERVLGVLYHLYEHDVQDVLLEEFADANIVGYEQGNALTIMDRDFGFDRTSFASQESFEKLARITKRLFENLSTITYNNYMNKLNEYKINEIADEQENTVKILTVHRSKGLEFYRVFLIGVSNKIFPSQYSIGPEGLAEENRLYYVAITRAKQRLDIIYTKIIHSFGNILKTNPSQYFLDAKQFVEDNNG